MGFFPREFMLRKVRHHNFYELADKLESVSLLSLFGGRRKEGQLSFDTLEDVFICPLKTEKAGSLMSRVQNKNTASIVVKEASAFFNRLAQHHDVWMREIAAAGHGLSEEAVRLLAKDHGFDVCNVLAKNPENLFKLNVEELIAFVKRDEAIKSQLFQNLVHFSGFSEDMIEAGVIDKLKTFVEAFANDPDGDLRETLEELRIRIEENDFVAPKTAHLRRRENLSCTNPYGRIGEYVFAIGLSKLTAEPMHPKLIPTSRFSGCRYRFTRLWRIGTSKVFRRNCSRGLRKASRLMFAANSPNAEICPKPLWTSSRQISRSSSAAIC